MDINIKNIKNRFLSIEEELKLFDLEVSGVKIWQYIRVWTFNAILAESGIYSKEPSKIKGNWRVLVKMVFYIIKNSLFRNAMIGRKKDLLIFTHPRRKLINGKYWDIYTDFLIENCTLDLQAIEEFSEGTHFTPAKTKGLKYFDFPLGLSYFFRKFVKVNITKTEMLKLQNLIKRIENDFRVKIDIVSYINRQLKLRKGLSWVFGKILDVYQPKLILEVSYYTIVRMVLNKVSKERNIPTVELQHGLLNPYHMAYNFPKNISLEIFPDYYFTFGKYWEENTMLPLPSDRIFSVGYPYLENESKKYKKKVDSNKILFISQWTIGEELSKFACEFANKSSYEVIYKLHPREYSDWERDYPCLKQKNIKVIDNDKTPFYKLFADSLAQVGVYSTSLYEGLMFGLKTFIVDLSGYENLEDIIQNGYAILIRNIEDLSRGLTNFREKTIDYEKLFKKNSIENQKNAINKILRSSKS